MKKRFTKLSVFVLTGLALFTNGCAIADSAPTPSNNASVVYTSTSQSKDDGYMYNRTNNLEYMDVKSIEKYKKAVAILIDKVDALESKMNAKYDSKQFDHEITNLKNEIGAMKNNTSQNTVNEPLTDDDKKILHFIENGEGGPR
ncbi:hypothetical protein [Sulfurospirillum multivorans]|uniref:Lipoprotein n=2 Tax=Sulfurospirillum multivorans TaxID=66821 RepID=A0AA86AP49_SULMK|nr:hypothetical protein [Sulfurospirillum multivorans]AHJ13003.1 hypothetical protein SMUL_1748 [Sulfurospirillum multivorans DSM 12446]QEH06493.1 hypothetical protein SMN_1728 [Sulfurospirillum multivorans]